MFNATGFKYQPPLQSCHSFSLFLFCSPFISIFPRPFIFHARTSSKRYSKWGTMCWWLSWCREQQVLVHRVCCMHSGLCSWWVLLYEAADTNIYVNELPSVSCYESWFNKRKSKFETFPIRLLDFSNRLYVPVCQSTMHSSKVVGGTVMLTKMYTHPLGAILWHFLLFTAKISHLKPFSCILSL